jgi:type VI secretion system protein ImpM
MNVGVFGKIPSYGDFVAMGTGTPVGRAFERWLQLSTDRLHQDGLRPPEGPIGFCFRDPAGDTALLGVLVDSQDTVGRVFPLALFAEIADTDAIGDIAALPPPASLASSS